MSFLRLLIKTAVLAATFLSIIGPAPIRQAAARGMNGGPYSVYLPVLHQINNSIFGAYLVPPTNQATLQKMTIAGMNWSRLDLSWKVVEATQGTIDWTKAAGFESRLSALINAGMHPIIIFGDTPGWALKPGFDCGAIASAHLAEYARFVGQAVQRYSGSAFNITHYEFYNEPDVQGFLGCWGDPSDNLYYGGQAYGQMLKSVYPAVKTANPAAQVLVGGLLLDCDPVNPPVGKNCVASNFLEGALVSGAANSLDGVAYHSYDYYDSMGNYSNSNWAASRDTTGPVSLAKAAFLTALLQRYSIGSKPLYNTEFALFYDSAPGSPADPQVEATKAYFLVHSMAGFLASNQRSAIWHETYGNRNNSLLQPDQTPYPVYTVYAYANNLLHSATYVKKITTDPNFVIYEFNKAGKKIWIAWTADNLSHPLTLPAATQSVTILDNLGALQTVSPPGLTLDPDLAPAFVVFTP